MRALERVGQPQPVVCSTFRLYANDGLHPLRLHQAPAKLRPGLLADPVHAEVLTDGVAELAQRGVVNCAAKTFMHGKVVS